MTDAPKSSALLGKVETRLRLASLARAVYITSLVVLGTAIAAVLTMRLLGLVPQSQEQPLWLLAIPAVIAVGAGLFHRRIARDNAARAVDQHANTKDLFLTLSSLNSSAGEYQPLVTTSAEDRAKNIVPDEVVPFAFARRLLPITALAGIFTLAVLFTPQRDPFGRVEAATKVVEQKKEIEAIKKSALSRADRLKKERERANEESEEIDDELQRLQKDFRKMNPNKKQANSQVLTKRGKELGDMWKSVAQNEQLRRMLNEPISGQQLGSRNKKMNEWLAELQEGKTDGLKEELKSAQETLKAMLEAKDPEQREKLASKLQNELQDLNKFAKDKAGSKELANALNKAMKAMRMSKNAKPGENAEQMELSKEAMEALKEQLKVSEMEMEKLAQSAKDLKKLEEALDTLKKAQELNEQQPLDGSKCEGCETMADYAELYAQLTGRGGAGEGDKADNNGSDGGIGRGGETQEDDSDPTGFKTEKEKPQLLPGKILLSIKTKEYAEEKDFDPDKMSQYQQSVNDIKSSVQSAIDSEEIPPGYVDGIKSYFDKIEKVDKGLSEGAE